MEIEELKNRIILTLGILLVYRFGAHIVLPGIDSAQFTRVVYQNLWRWSPRHPQRFYWWRFLQCLSIRTRDYALHLSFYRRSVDGNRYSYLQNYKRR